MNALRPAVRRSVSPGNGSFWKYGQPGTSQVAAASQHRCPETDSCPSGAANPEGSSRIVAKHARGFGEPEFRACKYL